MQVTGAFQGKAFSREEAQKTKPNQSNHPKLQANENNPKKPVRGVRNVEMYLGDEELLQPGKPPKAVSL